MGLFDKLRSATELQFDEQRAIMTIVIGAIMADGEAEDEEMSRMRMMCSLSPIFARNSVAQDNAVIDFVLRALRQLDWDDLIPRAAAALSPELRETAFAFACDMLMADGVVGRAEESYLEDLARRLSIQDSTANAVVEVTVIRNRTL